MNTQQQILLVAVAKAVDKPIPMCAACTDHNVKNRGGEIKGPAPCRG